MYAYTHIYIYTYIHILCIIICLHREGPRRAPQDVVLVDDVAGVPGRRVCMCAHVHMYVRTCVRACVRMCIRTCVRMCVSASWQTPAGLPGSAPNPGASRQLLIIYGLVELSLLLWLFAWLLHVYCFSVFLYLLVVLVHVFDLCVFPPRASRQPSRRRGSTPACPPGRWAGSPLRRESLQHIVFNNQYY